MSTIFGWHTFWNLVYNAIFYEHNSIPLWSSACPQHHTLKVCKTFWDSTTLWSKIIMKIIETLIVFWVVLPIVMRPVLIDSLDNVKNTDSNYSIFRRRSPCPPFGLSLKSCFFKLLQDHWSNFHQIQLGSCSEHAKQEVITNLMPLCQSVSAASLQSFDILTPNILCVFLTPHWSHQINLRTAPPISQKW